MIFQSYFHLKDKIYRPHIYGYSGSILLYDETLKLNYSCL